MSLDTNELWYKDGVIYQTHVRAFFDSNGDGIGDFQGLTQKLDYLQDLGVNIVWLLPFYPSPLRDDGYDIADYTAVNPSYGSLSDFKLFLDEAHRRGLRVVTELVINHTSDQHPWFQKSRRAKPGDPWRDFYVWSDTPNKYTDARIIFKDFETSNWAWDPVAQAYYWHRFFSHQPDLNFENPAVHDALFEVLEFWMDMGVDAFRLDAIPYLYEREGTTCENLPETHVYLKSLRRRMDEKYPGKMLLAEANQWPEDSLPYFGDGDECHMAFNFPVMPRMYMSLAMEDRFPIVDIMAQTPDIPPNCQWALFLRNHDELTLEMVTEEDRDYMWRTYANDAQARINLGIRRRLAPLLGNHRGRIQLMNGLLMSFPGTPIIYYGDEIGMGDNIYLGDRNGVRTPMQWSADRNAGFSRANPQKLFFPTIIDPEYHYEQVNVEAGQANQYSLLWWMKRLIALRKRYHAFGRGTMEFLHPENRKILAFVRHYEDENILVVANLSRHVQSFELDLAAYQGAVPVELSGGTKFPEVTERPYVLNLGPFAFYWFELQPHKIDEVAKVDEVPQLAAATWDELMANRARDPLAHAILRYVRGRRWFGAKSRNVSSLNIRDAFELASSESWLTIVEIEYSDGEPDLYLLPLGIAKARRAGEEDSRTATAIARLHDGAFLYEPVSDPAFAAALLDFVGGHGSLKGRSGTIVGDPVQAFDALRGSEPLDAQVLKGEQSNTAIVYGQRLFLKLFRRLQPGINTDLEVTQFLNEKSSFAQTPRLAGSIRYDRPNQESITIGIMQGFTENAGDAWRFTLDAIGRFFDDVISDSEAMDAIAAGSPDANVFELAKKPASAVAHRYIDGFLGDAELLGRRTAQMHLALASNSDVRAFAPEPFTPHYQRSIYEFVRTQGVQAFQLLRRNVASLPDDARKDAETLIARERDVQLHMRSVLDGKIGGLRIRTHGDYHLGQVLHTGNDFVIIDFEGEPSRPISERRIKRSALRDVAGMLRSFHYAPYAVLFGQAQGAMVRPEDLARLETAGRFWYRAVSAAFLRAYLDESAAGTHLPRSPKEIEVLLETHLLEKALYEIVYELNNRPEWLRIPLRGVLDLL